MKRYFFTLLALIFTSNFYSTFAAAPQNTDVDITVPIGGTILPGGVITGEGIKDGVLFSKVIPFIIKYMIGLTAALSVVVLIYAGYLYMTAYGDTDKYTKAQKTIMYAIIGLIIAITAYSIVTIVTNIQFS